MSPGGWLAAVRAVVWGVLILELAAISPTAIALLVLAAVAGSVGVLALRAVHPSPAMWDRSMLRLPAGERVPGYASVWLWWAIAGLCFLAIYLYFW
jgi:hypothetical protein